jgi:predicted small lipoprotein YifL
MIVKSLRAAVALLALSLAACGQKGPLYLPDTTQGEVVTRPSGTATGDGATTGPSNSPASPDSPGRAASPAPEVTAPATPPADAEDPESKDPGKTQPPQ